jgi:broad specificity phosphatase PhoE
MVTTFYLIRHGANDLVGRAIAGWSPGVHLNAEGRRQASELASRLSSVPFGHLFSSPLDRAQETAQPLADRLGLEIQTAEAVGEIQFGDWTGKPFDKLAPDTRWQQWNVFRSLARAPSGESMIEVQARFTGFLASLSREWPGETVAIFSHGDPIRSALMFYLGMPLDFVHRLEISPASISIVTIGPGGPQVVCANVTEDLTSSLSARKPV